MDTPQDSNQHKVIGDSVVFVGAVVGFSVYMVYGLAYETFVMPSLTVPGEPRLSYGQQAMLMAVISGALGGAIAFSAELCRHHRWASGSLLLVAASSGTCRFTAKMWADSFSRYGADPSDNIVFVPVFFASLVVLCLTILVVLIFAMSNIRQ